MMMVTWGYLIMEALYIAGLLALIFLSLVALLKRSVWISVLEACLLLGVCVSAVTLFESPPRPGVVGLVVCASLLCVSAFRRWRKLDFENKAAAAAATKAAAAATVAAEAATVAAGVATDITVLADSDEAKQAALMATNAANDAVLGAASAVLAAAAVTTEDAIREAAELARQQAVERDAQRYGDANQP